MGNFERLNCRLQKRGKISASPLALANMTWRKRPWCLVEYLWAVHYYWALPATLRDEIGNTARKLEFRAKQNDCHRVQCSVYSFPPQFNIFSPLLSTVLYLLSSSFLTVLFISPRSLYWKNSNVCTWKRATGVCTHRDTHTGHTNTHSHTKTLSHAHSHIHTIAHVLENFKCLQRCARRANILPLQNSQTYK